MLTYFEVGRVNALRARASTAIVVSPEGPEGWARGDADPMKLLGAFDTLRIKTGFALRAYQYRAYGDGNGVVWAMPEDAGWPSVGDCHPVHDGFLRAPRPEGAIDNFMDAIEGDHTPWSFISASLFSGEAQELGAMWHGVAWAVETILETDPWQQRPETEMGDLGGSREDWEWLTSAPADWRPTVEHHADQAAVTFFSFNPIGRQTVLGNVDTFAPGSLAFMPQRDPIAYGSAGATF